MTLARARAWPSTACWSSIRPRPSRGLAAASHLVSDLAPGRPLHAETWGHLLARRGFGPATVHLGGEDRRLDRVASVEPGCRGHQRGHRRGQRICCSDPASTSWSPSGSGDRRPPVRPRAAAPGRHRRPHAGPAGHPAAGRVGVGHLRRGGPRRAPATRPPTSSATRSGPSPGDILLYQLSTGLARWPTSCSAGPRPWSSTTTTSRRPPSTRAGRTTPARRWPWPGSQVAALAPRGHPGHRRLVVQRRRARARLGCPTPRWSPSWSRRWTPTGRRSTDGEPARLAAGPRAAHRAPVRRSALAQQGPAPPGRGPLALPALVRPRCPAPSGGPGGHRPYVEAVFALADELGLADAVRHGEDLIGGRAGRLVRRRRRVRVPVRARGLLHPPARGHARRPPHRGLCRRRRARDPGRRRHPARHQATRAWWPRPSTGSGATPTWPTRLVAAGHRRLQAFSLPAPGHRFVEVLEPAGRHRIGASGR